MLWQRLRGCRQDCHSGPVYKLVSKIAYSVVLCVCVYNVYQGVFRFICGGLLLIISTAAYCSSLVSRCVYLDLSLTTRLPKRCHVALLISVLDDRLS